MLFGILKETMLIKNRAKVFDVLFGLGAEWGLMKVEERQLVDIVIESVLKGNLQFPREKRDVLVRRNYTDEDAVQEVDRYTDVIVVDPMDFLAFVTGRYRQELRYKIEFTGFGKRASQMVVITTYGVWQHDSIDAMIQRMVDKQFLNLGYEHDNKNTRYIKRDPIPQIVV